MKLLFTSGLLATVVIGLLTFLQTPPITAPAQDTAITVPFISLVQGQQSSIDSRVNYLLTSPDELKELWNIIGATSTPPEVDFETQAVLAVFAGEKPAMKAMVIKIEDMQDIGKRIVSIFIAKPEESCQSQIPSRSPYEIVAVAATSLALTHQDIVETMSCAD